MPIINGMLRYSKPNTKTQAEAFAEGYAAFLKSQAVTDNPHNTDVRHIWWRYGWLQAKDDSREE